jgi:SAM-dependent methyltransferase
MTKPGVDYQGRDLEAMSAAVNYHQWILDEIQPFLGDSVAEVGAGIGSVSEMLLERGVGKLAAFEPSAQMFALLQENLGGEARARVINDFFSPSYAAEQFDSVVYLNVLEHIPEDGKELAGAFECLRPGGHLIIFVPALQWLYSDFDREVGHFRRYTLGGLKSIVAGAGFSIVRARYFDIAGVLPWYLNFVLLRNTMGKGSVALYDKVAVPIMKRVESVLRPPLGKNVLLIARKDTR